MDGKIFSTQQKIFTKNKWLMEWNAGLQHEIPKTVRHHHLSSLQILVRHLHDTIVTTMINKGKVTKTRNAIATATVNAMVTKREMGRIPKKRIPNINLLVLIKNPFVLSMVNHSTRELSKDVPFNGAQSALHLVGQLRITAARTAEKSMLETILMLKQTMVLFQIPRFG